MVEDIIDSYVIIEKPLGIGYALGSSDDLEKYVDFYISEDDLDNSKLLYVFNNDLPYFMADTQVVILKEGNFIKTNETEVIKFSEYPVFLLEDMSENLQLGVQKCLR